MGARRFSKAQKRLKHERLRQHKQPIPPSVVPPVAHSPRKEWSRSEIWTAIGAVIGGLAFVVTCVAAYANPDVRRLVPWNHDHNAPQATPQATPQPQPPKEQEPEEPPAGKPHIRYVPLPNADPFKTPGTLVTSVPKEGDEVQTVSINGEMVPVMTQEDAEKVLAHKVPASAFVKSSGKVDLFLAIGQDGTVQNVQIVSGDKSAGEEAKEAVKQWRFKPFIKDGEQVAVQTVIQLERKDSEKQ